MIGALVPELNREAYLKRLLEISHQLFEDYLFDEQPAGEVEGLSFARDDEAGPHYPWSILWRPEFAGDFELVHALNRRVTEEQLRSSFGALLRGVERLLSENDDERADSPQA